MKRFFFFHVFVLSLLFSVYFSHVFIFPNIIHHFGRKFNDNFNININTKLPLLFRPVWNSENVYYTYTKYQRYYDVYTSTRIISYVRTGSILFHTRHVRLSSHFSFSKKLIYPAGGCHHSVGLTSLCHHSREAADCFVPLLDHQQERAS